jgi:hypothetical protein
MQMPAEPGTLGLEMESVRNGAELCFDRFNESCQLVNEAANRDPASFVLIQEQFERFKIWASNIGVFADLHASLDFRVRDHEEIKKTFLGHLKVIEFRLRHRTLSFPSLPLIPYINLRCN